MCSLTEYNTICSLQIKLRKYFIMTQSIYRFWEQLIGPAVCVCETKFLHPDLHGNDLNSHKKSLGLMIQRTTNNTNLSAVIWEDTGRLQQWNKRKICISRISLNVIKRWYKVVLMFPAVTGLSSMPLCCILNYTFIKCEWGLIKVSLLWMHRRSSGVQTTAESSSCCHLQADRGAAWCWLCSLFMTSNHEVKSRIDQNRHRWTAAG